jgi:hypothetical protein
MVTFEHENHNLIRFIEKSFEVWFHTIGHDFTDRTILLTAKTGSAAAEI